MLLWHQSESAIRITSKRQELLGVLSLSLSNEKAKQEGKIEFGPRFEGVSQSCASKRDEGSETKFRLRVAAQKQLGYLVLYVVSLLLNWEYTLNTNYTWSSCVSSQHQWKGIRQPFFAAYLWCTSNSSFRFNHFDAPVLSCETGFKISFWDSNASFAISFISSSIPAPGWGKEEKLIGNKIERSKSDGVSIF